MAEEEKVHIGLNIDDREGPIVITLNPFQDAAGKHVSVLAEGVPASEEGAQQVIATLLVTADAIAQELGTTVEQIVTDMTLKPKPKRPRFNPQPRGGQ